MDDLTPLGTDTKQERIIKHLKAARLMLPYSDEQIAQKVKRDQQQVAKKRNAPGIITLHQGTNGWSFDDYIKDKQFDLAWKELKWACERYDAMQRIGGGNRRCKECNKIL